MLKLNKTKRLLVVIAAALALTTAIAVSSKTAKAEARDYARSGMWTNYAGRTDATNSPVCGMYTRNSEHNMSLHIKLINGKIWVAAFKSSWRFKEETPVKVDIAFDGTDWGDATARGYMYGQSGVVAFSVRDDSVASFLREVSEANKMMLRFPEGNETAWHANMEGSRAAINSLKDCGSRIGADTAPSQPYKPTQPTAQAPSQPYAANSPQSQTPPYSYKPEARVETPKPEARVEVPPSGETRVKLHPRNGMVMIDVIIGGVPTRMLFDSGANITSINDGVAAAIIANGQGYMKGRGRATLADGSVQEFQTMYVKELRIGPHTVRDLTVSVSPGETMLLSFPVVSGIGPFTIDTQTSELIWRKKG